MADGTTALIAAVAGNSGFGTGDRRERYLGPGDIAPTAEEKERLTVEVARTALELGVELSAANQSGDTALHVAASQALDAVVQLLVDKGAALESPNKRGLTPLGVAVIPRPPNPLQIDGVGPPQEHGRPAAEAGRERARPRGAEKGCGGPAGASAVPGGAAANPGTTPPAGPAGQTPARSGAAAEVTRRPGAPGWLRASLGARHGIRRHPVFEAGGNRRARRRARPGHPLRSDCIFVPSAEPGADWQPAPVVDPACHRFGRSLWPRPAISTPSGPPDPIAIARCETFVMSWAGEGLP